MSLSRIFGRTSRTSDEEHWLTVSDLMSGLMMIFLFIAISYMRVIVEQRDRVEEVIVAWDQTQEAVYMALRDEFEKDLPKWNAEIDRQDLAVRFKEPDVLFQRGDTALQDKFKRILADFFPRYVRRLQEFSNCEPQGNGRPRGCIEEVRIEGHTSSEWTGSSSAEEAYFNNMALSQGRTRSVLQYCQGLVETASYPWLRDRIAAVGFSSSRPIRMYGGVEDRDRSRRVEFRVKTTVEKQLMRIIKED